MKARRWSIIILVILIAIFVLRGPLKNSSEAIKRTVKSIVNATSTSFIENLQEIIPLPLETATTTPAVETSTSTPAQNINQTSKPKPSQLPPVTSNQQERGLTARGIIIATNAERSRAGLDTLTVDANLTRAAEFKLQDMFQNQYFEHVSPSGEGVSDVAKKAGYEYIVVGENLALGIFSGDASVVAAWMASPGHKRNILDPRYQDIGIAVGQGMYKGRKQWLIVQHFGKPLSSCVQPNESLKEDIERTKRDLVIIEAEIQAKKAEAEKAQGDAYVKAAQEYNALVTRYNSMVEFLKTSITIYNESVRKFNGCAGL